MLVRHDHAHLNQMYVAVNLSVSAMLDPANLSAHLLHNLFSMLDEETGMAHGDVHTGNHVMAAGECIDLERSFLHSVSTRSEPTTIIGTTNSHYEICG
jgi:predicted unusual protein kinase regulating ubiquinone biosynthesis (AarF/ABC1/UbiB family)